MFIRIVRSLCAATAIVIALFGCSGASEDKNPKAEQCVDLREQVEAAAAQVNDAFTDYNDYTEGQVLARQPSRVRTSARKPVKQC